MKTIYATFFTVLFGFVGVSHAQLDKGDLMVGADLGSGLVSSGSNGLFGVNLGLNGGSGFNIGLSPKVGFFLKDNFMLGASVNLGFTKSPEENGESTKTTVYGFQALARYYIRPKTVELDGLPNKALFFFENNAGIAGFNVKDGINTNGFAFGFGPGVAYFLGNNVAVETTFKYNGLLGAGVVDYQHSLGLNLGIKIFLPSNTIRNQIDQFN